ncbi:MAG: hypothetical protein DHS20C18_55030 [Saprospiraceae bacterium]|nr:MAG: hypothetical protein DHS20C18_55030 [Saprospiraceae bacterium]
MARRLKITGFTRFFIVMLFLIPGAYIGASYYNGEDGIQNIKNLLGLDKKSDNQTTTTIQPDPQQNTTHTDNTTEDLRQRIQDLESENEKLKAMIRNRDREIEDLKKN